MLDVMPGGTDMIWKVTRAFNLDPKDLLSGAVDLCFISEMHDYLTLEQDNENRIARWRQANEC